MPSPTFEQKLEIVRRHPAFAARLMRESAEEALVASVLGILFDQLPAATSKVVLEVAAIVRQHG